ncbi:hypothetical protein ACTQ49_12870 [Luteococcus sp. Sow4_B9]|uniref:hypothetical protein n=1 Tax=Luteococcus sp. Sow4_B9 TaxID=3438792 RepID=UPI003F9D8339
MSETADGEVRPRPRTGHPDVDEALRSVEDLGGKDLREHHDLLSGVQDQLAAVLEESRRPPVASIPEGLRPRRAEGAPDPAEPRHG